MLFQLGPVTISVAPLNVDRVGRSSGSDFVAKPVVGALEPLEYVGPGASTFRLSGTVFPQRFGGLSQIEILRLAMNTGVPQYLLRGDGTALGWFAITSLQEDSTHLDARGVGRKIDISIDLRRASPPGALEVFGTFVGLLVNG